MSAHVYRRPYDYALNLRLQARKRLGVGGRNIIEAAGSVSIAFVVDGEGLALGDGDGLVSLAATVSGAGASVANADSSIALSFALAGDAAAIAEADGSVSLVSTLAAEGEGLVFEQLHSRFGADDGAEGANTQLAAEDVDVSLGKEATVRLRQQLDLTGHLTALSGRLYYRRVGDPDAAWDTLDPEEFADPDFGTLQVYSRYRAQDLTLQTDRIVSADNRGALHGDFDGAPTSSEPTATTQDGIPVAATDGVTSNQHLISSLPASDYEWMDDGTGGVDFYGLVWIANADLPFIGLFGTGGNSSTGKGLRLRSTGSEELDARWGNGAANVGIAVSANGVLKPGWQLIHVAADHAGSLLAIYRNNVQVASDVSLGSVAAGVPATELRLAGMSGITASTDARWAQWCGYYNSGGSAHDSTKRDALYELFKQRYPILRLFDDSIGLFAAYQFNSPYPQTHVANGATRIQTLNSANGGAQLTGLITDFEPRLVTKDGYQWARVLVNGGEGTANDQGFQDVGSGAGTAYEAFYDGTAWACYFVCEPDQVGGTFFCTDTDFSSLGHILRFNNSGNLGLLVHNGTDQVVSISSPQAYAPGGLKVFTFRYNGSNLFEILVNNVVVASGAPQASFGSGATGDDTVFFNDLSGGNMLAGHHLHMLLCTGVDHSQNGIGTEIYRGLRHHYKDLVFG